MPIGHIFITVIIEVASVIELSEASGRVAAGLFMIILNYQIYPPTIDTLVTGMSEVTIQNLLGSIRRQRQCGNSMETSC